MDRSDTPHARRRVVGTSSALEALADHVSATMQPGDDRADGYVTIGKRRVAVDVIGDRGVSATPVPTLRLREDRVALPVLRDIESAVASHVPGGMAVVFTLGAPIHVPSQTIAAVAKQLVSSLATHAAERDRRATILNNRLRFRVLRDGTPLMTNVTGFVFSGDPAPRALANAMRSMHAEIAAKAASRELSSVGGDRWLLLSSDYGITDFKTLQRMCERLALPDAFGRIFAVRKSGAAAPLTTA